MLMKKSQRRNRNRKMVRYLKTACRESMPQKKKETEKWQTWPSAWPSGQNLQPSLPKKVQLKWRGVKRSKSERRRQRAYVAVFFHSALNYMTWQNLRHSNWPEHISPTQHYGSRAGGSNPQPPNISPTMSWFLSETVKWMICKNSFLIGKQRLWRRSN